MAVQRSLSVPLAVTSSSLPHPGVEDPLTRGRGAVSGRQLVGRLPGLKRWFMSGSARLRHHCLAICALLEVGECACRVFQRKWGTHRDPDCPGGEQFAEPCQPRPIRCLIHLTPMPRLRACTQ